MKAADQIELVARQATGELAAISRAFTATQRQLAGDLATHRGMHDDAEVRLRADLTLAAEMSEVSTPQIMLPADMAQASPHHRRDNA